jgi:hypothetical protein
MKNDQALCADKYATLTNKSDAYAIRGGIFENVQKIIFSLRMCRR